MCRPSNHRWRGRDAWVFGRGGIQLKLRARRACDTWSAGASTSSLGLMLARALVTSVLALSLAGCFPMRFVSRPGISGVVLDDSTHDPLASANVTLRMHTWDGKVVSTTSTTSGTDGAFVIPAKHVWWIYFVGMDFLGYYGTADLKASGFAQASREVRSSPVGPSVVPLGDIRLTRAP